MNYKNLLIVCNRYPDMENKYIGGIFINEQINYLKKWFKEIYVISPAIYGIEYFRKTHHKDYEFDNVRILFPKYVNLPLFYFYFRDVWIYLEKRAIIKSIKEKKIQFDLIHAHYTWPSGAVAAELGKEFQVPLVITEHTSDTFEKAIKNKDNQYIKSWKFCDAIIRIRKGDMKFFDSVGISSGKTNYIPNGYDAKKFAKFDKIFCQKKLNIPLNKKVVLTVGNLDEVKGHKYLIEAMVEIKKFRDDVFCIIVGQGNLETKLKKQIIESGLEKEVKLVGMIKHYEIPIWINACDIFVLPSLNEGNPTVMFECLGCGKPFIGTTVGGIPEIITSEEYGLLCKPANSKELAQKILIALDNEWDSDKIMNYGHQFTWENIAEEIIKVYEKIVYND